MQTVRAHRLLDAVSNELTQYVAVLEVERESRDLLIVTRAGRPAELRLEWRASSGVLLVTSRARRGAPTDLARYAWVRAEGRWARTDAPGHLFADLATLLDERFFAPEPGPT